LLIIKCRYWSEGSQEKKMGAIGVELRL
jgi:hypothetical protein